MIKAVLFDFNGVLFKDRKWHEEAWNKFSKHLRNKELNREDFEQYVHGRIPKDTFAFLLDNSPSSEELKKYSEQKERLYQRIALNSGDELKLSPGAIELFEILDENNIKKNIATSAPLINVKFYYKHLGLEKWFPFQDIVFDDGTFLGKPAPDIYLKAARKINVNIKNCMVIEDAKSGVESAKKAMAGRIIFLVNNDNRVTAQKLKVYKIIRSLHKIKLEDFGIKTKLA